MAEEHETDRVGKYAPYFQGNTILPIPNLLAAMVPKDPVPYSHRPKNKETGWELQASHADIFAGKATPSGMSCCPWRNYHQN